MKILGISAYYHDSAACLIEDGRIIAAAQEERFSRKKADARFPKHAIAYCLKEANLSLKDVDYVTFYDKPLIKFERLLETYLAFAPKGFKSFVMSMPVWLKDKLFLKATLKKELEKFGLGPKLLFASHHGSHAASAFFPSPYESAAVLCLDGVGEWATTTGWKAKGNKLELLWELNFPHSLGLLYSAFTYYCGFKVNSGEYKLMGLAPYGEPKYVDKIYEHLMDLKEDGSFRLNMEYFDFATGLTMTSQKFHKLFGGEPRAQEGKLTQKDMDLARSVQVVTEEVMLRLARSLQKETGEENLCLAGGVALNCVANGRILREGIFKNIWIQPAAGDAGGALGAAFSTWYEYLKNERKVEGESDSMQGSFLGPRYSEEEVTNFLGKKNLPYEQFESVEKLNEKLVELIAEGNVIGYMQGRMEWGPRALCSRSIIGDARNREMQSKMNLKIKYRESFRPFAPVVLAEDVSEFFEIDRESPYMLLVADVKKELRLEMTEAQKALFGIDKLNVPRSTIPAITHVDYSARLQTVHKETNPKFHSLVSRFKEKTGCSVLVNTSFNVRGEPIVCSSEDAYRCFMRTEMDYLVLENCLLDKHQKKKKKKDESWKKEFELD